MECKGLVDVIKCLLYKIFLWWHHHCTETCETREKAFHFTSKALFVLFTYSSDMTSSNIQAWNTKLILLYNVRSKVSLVMKFGEFMQLYKLKFFIRKFCEIYCLETSSKLSLIFREFSVERNLRKSAYLFEHVLIALLWHIWYKQLPLKISF